jgi:hypothetical protein
MAVSIRETVIASASEAIQSSNLGNSSGLLRRFAPRNGDDPGLDGLI